MKSLTRRITGENKRKIREVEKLGAMAPMSFALLNFAYLLGPPHHQYHKDQKEIFWRTDLKCLRTVLKTTDEYFQKSTFTHKSWIVLVWD